jgi:crotonobetainyl-CoA:carnitine CoA-transferase CaiB-like acyl-CoA transferase
MADMGAEVTKVEPVESGDETRGWPPFRDGEGAVFLSLNRNKRSLALDLKREEGRAVVRRLARQADVVVENYAEGVAARLGVAYADLAPLNERLVYCSISGFGRRGPLKHVAAYDVVLQAFCGMMSLTGEPGSGPIRSPFSPIDQTTGMHALAAILAALLRAARTGKGAFLEVSLFDSALGLLAYQLQTFWETGKLPAKNGSGHNSMCPYQAFQASDGPFLLGIGNEGQWQRFCKAVGVPALADDPRFRTNAERVANYALTVDTVQGILAGRTGDEWLEILAAVRVPCSPIKTLAELLDHPHTKARDTVASYRHPRLGSLHAVMQPVVIDEAPRQVRRPPPGHGEHSREILREAGYAETAIDALVDDGTIHDGGAP